MDGRNLIRRFITTHRRSAPVTRGYADTLHVRRCKYDVERRVGVTGTRGNKTFYHPDGRCVYLCAFIRA